MYTGTVKHYIPVWLGKTSIPLVQAPNSVVRLNACDHLMSAYPLEDRTQDAEARARSLERQHRFVRTGIVRRIDTVPVECAICPWCRFLFLVLQLSKGILSF